MMLQLTLLQHTSPLASVDVRMLPLLLHGLHELWAPVFAVDVRVCVRAQVCVPNKFISGDGFLGEG